MTKATMSLITDGHHSAITSLNWQGFFARPGWVIVGLFGLVCSNAPALADEALIEKGRYLVTAADCAACHTREDGKPFAGGHVIESPFGDLVTPNITPDPEAGIGSWSLEEFQRVLHEGVNEDGDHMYPAMPYRFFTKITDDDVEAIWAFMQSVEPVDEQVAEHDMSFPANIRLGLAVWKELNLETGRFEPNPDRDDVYNRGKYLVDALAHCSACHSPRNFMMGLRDEAAFTGAVVDDWYAPNISSGSMSVIDDWSIDDLTEYLRTGKNRTNTKAVGSMSKVVHSSLSKLDESDVRAMATYLKTMPEPEEGPGAVEEQAGTDLSDREMTAGRAIYAENCLSCHQPQGKGIDGRVPALSGTSVVMARKPNTAILLVLQGHEVDEESWGAMPAFADLLGNEEISDVVNYVRGAWSNEEVEAATAELVSELREGAEIADAQAPQVGLFCPVAGEGALGQAATEIDEERIEAGAQDAQTLQDIVSEVRDIDSEAADREIITALSSRYCLVLAAADSVGTSELNARVAEFSGQVAAAIESQM